MSTATKYLRQLSDPRHCQDFDASQLAYGILWADESCRTSGTLSMALRRASPTAAGRLLGELLKAGLTTTGEVPRWLNANEQRALEILASA